MNLKKLSSIPAIPLLFTLSLSADPILVTQWNRTDSYGVQHEYSACNFQDHSWEASNDQGKKNRYPATGTSSEEQNSLIGGLKGLISEYWWGSSQTRSGTDPSDSWSWVTGGTNDAYGPASKQNLAAWSKWGAEKELWNNEGYLPSIAGFMAKRSDSVPESGKLSLFAVGWLAILSMVRRKKA